MSDVAARIVQHLLEFCASRGGDTQELLRAARQRLGNTAGAAFELTPEYVNAGGEPFSWNHFALLLDLWSAAVGGEAGEQAFISDHFAKPSRFGPSILPLRRLDLGTEFFFETSVLVARRMLFTNLQTTGVWKAKGRLRLQLELRPEDADSAVFFRMAHAVLAELPRALGMPQAAVEAAVSARHGAYEVVLPAGSGRPSWLRQMGARLGVGLRGRSVVQEQMALLSEVYSNLMARHMQLENEVVQKKQAFNQANDALMTRNLDLREFEHIAHIGKWEWDFATDMVLISEECRAIFGIARDVRSAERLALVASIHPDDRSAVHNAVEQTRATGVPLDIEHRINHQDGSVRYVHERGALFPGKHGSRGKLVGSVQDISLRKDFEQGLIRARDAANAASRMKSTFLANMSHEIRTPMTSVLGFADLLTDPGLAPAKRQEYANRIQRNGRHLLAIIDDILDLSKIEAGHLKLEFQRFALAPALTQVVDMLRAEAEAKQLRLNLRLDAVLPIVICNDPQRFRQILFNVVGNAVKFTEHGNVEVSVSYRAKGGQHLVEIAIKDTGPGITAEHQHRLFQPFSQANLLGDKVRGGTGLGLALARNLAHLIGGDLVLTASAPGVGSCFVLTVPRVTGVEGSELPLAGLEPDDDAPQSTANSDSLPPLTQLLASVLVLLVEDNADVREITQRLLRDAGAQVETAENGLVCLDIINTRMSGYQSAPSFDVVLMDIQMPVLDGLSTVKTLRAQGFLRPILALTAFATSGERQRCLAAGCSDYLTKPIDGQQLLRTVHKWSQWRRSD